ncbi:MAG: FecR domain-containing protein [Spirochaetaceae bacterium]|jgi:hypothetical protein|nr:FecR domain-containing protein [Spirochaetaceae bacterium]
MLKLKYIVLTMLFFIPLQLFAQNGSVARIEYINGISGEVLVTHTNGEIEDAFIGMEVPLESSIETKNATVELRLDPNGTILKLDSNTLFVLNSIQGRRGEEETSMTLLRGRLRTIAAKAGIFNKYTVRTPSAVCGIRGTEILNIVSPGENAIICKSGSVEVTNTVDTADTLLIGANQRVDTSSMVGFQALTLTPEQINQVFNSMPFENLSPMSVPGHAEEVALADPTGETTAQDETTQDEPTQDQEEPAVAAPAQDETAVQDDAEEDQNNSSRQPATVPTPTDSEEDSESDGPSALEDWFSNYMGFELGAVNIDGVTYSKVIAQPNFETDKLSLGLYLPIIYNGNMMDPNDWYKPEGNSEWSFGSDQDEVLDIISDFTSDLILKIKYLEYGDQLWDPFYIKAGNLDSMTLGHGSLIQNYSNYTNFPAERLVGVNLGLNVKNFRVETLVDDAKDPSLAGLRLQYGTEGLSAGIASVVDLYPGDDISVSIPGDPYLMGLSLDMEFLKINTDLFKLIAYADVSTVLPIFRENPENSYIKWNNAFEYIYNDSTLKNYGAKAGIIGEVALLDDNLDNRYENAI